jgi:peptidoglycan/LPS O-acetylase OafA/YrhL
MSNNQNTNVKVYFENLNTIRFIAASMVIIHHTEQLRSLFNLPNFWDNKVVFVIGKLGVILFFVLSGFLISYLLFKEKEITNTISIKKFYIRRILRIWPLYFFIIILAFFVLPFLSFFTFPSFGREIVWNHLGYKLFLFVFFLPNLNFFGLVPYASQTWSIGAEEQFYLIWPVLNKKKINKWLLMFTIITIYLIIKFSIFYLPDSQIKIVFQNFWNATPIDCMAIGGIFALIAYENNSKVNTIKKILFSRIVQWFVLTLTVYSITFNFTIQDFHYEYFSILFGILILNFGCNDNRIFSMEYKIFNYLGKISYGIYMFHPIVIVFSIKLCQILDLQSNYILYPLVFLLIIILSSLSYEYFEKFFINKKVKYSDVISGDNIRK